MTHKSTVHGIGENFLCIDANAILFLMISIAMKLGSGNERDRIEFKTISKEFTILPLITY